MADEQTALLSITAQQYLMKKAIEAPEDIYAKIAQAEAWLEELKDIARDKLISKMPKDDKTYDIETLEHTIHITRNRGHFKPEVVYATLLNLKIDASKIVREKVEYEMLPEAFPILEAYLRDKIITQAQFDSMFKKGNFTVKLKPKSAMTVALNSQNGK